MPTINNNTTAKLTTAQLTDKVASLENTVMKMQGQLSNLRDEIFSISKNTPRAVTEIATNVINQAIENERSKRVLPPSNN